MLVVVSFIFFSFLSISYTLCTLYLIEVVCKLLKIKKRERILKIKNNGYACLMRYNFNGVDAKGKKFVYILSQLLINYNLINIIKLARTSIIYLTIIY
jgi:hypothetical protein